MPYEHIASLDELYQRSDAIVLACPLTDETRDMINGQAFAQMKDGVVLVNVARGGLVNEKALIDALDSGKVLRAGLDAFPHEPKINPDIMAHPKIVSVCGIALIRPLRRTALPDTTLLD